jgi:hypothetical protein
MIKTQGQVTHDSLHVLGISVHPILLSDWKDLALLDPLTIAKAHPAVPGQSSEPYII